MTDVIYNNLYIFYSISDATIARFKGRSVSVYKYIIEKTTVSKEVVILLLKLTRR